MDIANFNKNFCLHDSVVDDVFEKNGCIVFNFCSGIHEFDTNKNSYIKKNNRQLVIKVDGLIKSEEYHHVCIAQFKRNKRKEINFESFVKLVKKNKYIVYLDFYSYFAKGFLVKGFAGKNEIEILITEVLDYKII